jgi:hypothetical protein
MSLKTISLSDLQGHRHEHVRSAYFYYANTGNKACTVEPKDVQNIIVGPVHKIIDSDVSSISHFRPASRLSYFGTP